jgi:ABC-2 type transport system ATP-binding protein
MAQPAIVVRDLRKSYGEVTALDGLSFEVPAGTVLGLLGPNGSGKTSTVAILSTATRADNGQASVCGADVIADPARVRGLIGFAGQFAAVDPDLTGRENLSLIGRLSRLPRRQARERAAQMLARFGLAEAGDRLVRTYSGGMRRRLDLAAALAHRPPVLFLDEPTAGLDPESRLELWQMIRELAADGTTVLLTTQYLAEADALASEIVLIRRGRVAAAGTPAQLKAAVGATVIELGFADEPAAAGAADALAARGYAAERAGSSVVLRSPDGPAVLVGMIRALDGRAADPAAVTVREPTLDDVFLTVAAGPGRTDPGRETA